MAFPAADPMKSPESSSMTLSSDGISVHMRIPAEQAYLANALLTLREICDHLDISLAQANRILLALEESLLNTVEHAYVQCDGMIDLQFAVEGSEFMVVVEDFGCGLPFEGPLPPIADHAILQDRGRGLHILRGMADKTVMQSTNGRGTRTTMMFQLESPTFV
jgi:anti-sigma regulatory factor (Ser/Thr protein kinase)